MLAFIRHNPAKTILGVLIGLLALLTYMTTVKNGSSYCYNSVCGIYFWGAHTVDGLWHIAIMQHAFDTVPFTIPIFSGHPFGGYNYLLDLITAPLQLVGLSPVFIYFKILPIAWIVLMILLLNKICQTLKKSLTYLISLIIFVFFGTGFYFMFALYHHGSVLETDGGGGALYLTNMQFSFSLVGILLVILVLLSKKQTVKHNLILGLLVFLITGFKFYAGVIVGMLILTYSLVRYIKERGHFASFVMPILFTAAGFILAIFLIFDPLTNLGQGGEPIFSFAPFALAHRFIEEPDRLYIPSLALARYTLLEGGWGPRLIALEIFASLVYIFFEFGTRIIGFFTVLVKSVRRRMTPLDISLFSAVIFGLALSLILVQRGQWWNVIQFLYVGLFLISFHSADALEWLIRKGSLFSYSAIALIIATIIPFNIVTFQKFADIEKHGKYIPLVEQEALRALKNMPDGAMLKLPARINRAQQPPRPQPMWYQTNSPYVSVYGDKTSYVEAIETLKILNVDYQERLDHIRNADISMLRDAVDYVYAYGPEKPYCNHEMHIRRAGEEVFNNTYVSIYTL